MVHNSIRMLSEQIKEFCVQNLMPQQRLVAVLDIELQSIAMCRRGNNMEKECGYKICSDIDEN